MINHFDRGNLKNGRYLQQWGSQSGLSVHCKKEKKNCTEQRKNQLSQTLLWTEFWVWQEGAVEDRQAAHSEIWLPTGIQQRIISDLFYLLFAQLNHMRHLKLRPGYV